MGVAAALKCHRWHHAVYVPSVGYAPRVLVRPFASPGARSVVRRFASARVDSDDPYEVLGVTRSCTDAELKRAYLRAAKEWHPDVNPGDPLAKQRFQRISQAYSLLRDPQQRAQFDASGSWSSGPASGSEYSRAEDTFRNFSQDRDVILDAMRLYAETVAEEGRLAADLIWQGRWSEAWPIVQNHRVLFAGVATLAVLVRFPAAVAGILRIGAAAMLHPAVFRVLLRLGLDQRLWQWAWQHLVAGVRREHDRLQRRAATRRSEANSTQQHPPPPKSPPKSPPKASGGSGARRAR